MSQIRFCFLFLFLSFALLLAVILFPFKGFAQGDDTYNFYFQKGQAPQNVIQSGNGQATRSSVSNPSAAAIDPRTESNLTPAENLLTQIPNAWTPKPIVDHQTFHILAGFAGIRDEIGAGGAYSLGLQYNFNRHLGLRGTVTLMDMDSLSYNENTRPNNEESNSNTIGGRAALVFTPFRLQVLGHRFLDLGFQGGVKTARHLKNDQPVERDVEVKPAGFVGATAMLNMNENFGIEACADYSARQGFGQLAGSAVFKF